MSRDADVLNRLISRLRAAALGYRKAGSDGPGLSDVFGAAADAHDRTAEELAAIVRALGATPDGAPDPDRHAWADLPRAVSQGEEATTQAVKQAEAELIADLQAGVDDDDVSEPVRDAIASALNGVEAGRRRALERLQALGG